MDSIILAYFLLVLLPCACFTAVAAGRRGYSTVAWFFAGLLFGLIGLLAVMAQPIRSAR